MCTQNGPDADDVPRRSRISLLVALCCERFSSLGQHVAVDLPLLPHGVFKCGVPDAAKWLVSLAIGVKEAGMFKQPIGSCADCRLSRLIACPQTIADVSFSRLVLHAQMIVLGANGALLLLAYTFFSFGLKHCGPIRYGRL